MSYFMIYVIVAVVGFIVGNNIIRKIDRLEKTLKNELSFLARKLE